MDPKPFFDMILLVVRVLVSFEISSNFSLRKLEFKFYKYSSFVDIQNKIICLRD
jgi:hypothetical protein